MLCSLPANICTSALELWFHNLYFLHWHCQSTGTGTGLGLALHWNRTWTELAQDWVWAGLLLSLSWHCHWEIIKFMYFCFFSFEPNKTLIFADPGKAMDKNKITPKKTYITTLEYPQHGGIVKVHCWLKIYCNFRCWIANGSVLAFDDLLKRRVCYK